ncbi:MAG: PEP-CTERM sorting domain-containing protein [Acidobacteriaceae bacterium]|nr:PEP-CTERM sorting domain-containing protein [Acidobacteriaceae bacterium]
MFTKLLLRYLVNWLAVLAAALFMGTVLYAGTTYSFKTVNNPGDPNFNQLLGISNSGEIVGYFGDGTVLPNKGFTTVPPYTSFTNENFPGSVQTQVVGINNNSTPVTVGFWIDGSANNFGFVDQNGSFTSVKDPNTPTSTPTTNQLLGVNNGDIAVGFYNDSTGAAHAYSYNIASKSFTAITLPSSFGATSTTATGINNAGVISGFYTNAAGIHGFLDKNGTFFSLDDPSGTNTMFFGLNNKNQAVGSFVNGSGLTNGLIYNWVTNMWQTVTDPNQSSSTTPAFGVTGTTINGINDLGQLVGFYSDGTHVNGTVATPTPEPASVMLMGLGAILVGVVRLRKTRRAG